MDKSWNSVGTLQKACKISSMQRVNLLLFCIVSLLFLIFAKLLQECLVLYMEKETWTKNLWHLEVVAGELQLQVK